VSGSWLTFRAGTGEACADQISGAAKATLIKAIMVMRWYGLTFCVLFTVPPGHFFAIVADAFGVGNRHG